MKEEFAYGTDSKSNGIRIIFKIKERIKEKKKQKQANKNNGSKK